MAYHEFSERREIIEKIQQGELKQRFISKPVAVGDTVEFVSAPPLLHPHEALDFPEENLIRAVIQVSKVDRAEEGAGLSDHGKPWLIHWVAPASIR